MIEEIAKEFFQVMPVLRKNVIKPLEKRSDSISPMQLHVLLHLKDQKPRAMSELAAEMGILKQQLTLLMDKLAEQQFIQRIPDPDDRRSVRITITPTGMDYIAGIHQETLKYIAQRLENLSADDLQELHSAIKSMLKIFNKI